ncbi:glycosyltransferase family A protein [Streptomyces sp. 1331.2]|uniref:glycosyltransferase family A protein n=1 Tax=Streptomyces sp. 1331.2 TaxID=1938835 RepID=UPI000BC9686F|nr:glycosyltransferase family A protein [Streptomyces sp. 1331.2]SOB83326.1 Glycosyltransferase involved in cell wall bisynthesis [Streptomyces sp. 1331.2]
MSVPTSSPADLPAALPLVSVVIPLYNDARTLPACLEAVAAQTYPNVEIVVVDDASTDDSARIAERYPCRLIRQETNSGPAETRNRGAREARGEIVFFLDADVGLSPTSVASAVEQLAADPQVGSVCGITDKHPLLPTTKVGDYRILQSYYWRISSEGTVTPWFSALAAIRRALFLESGGLNPALRQTEEIDFGVRLSATHRIELSSQVVGRHNDEEQLSGLVRKLFRRARLRVPLYVDHRGFMRGFETRSRAVAALAAAGAVASLPLALLSPRALPATAALAAGAVLADRGFHAFLVRERGVGTAVAYTALHFAAGAAVTAGAAVGAGQWLLSPEFRSLYRRQAAAAASTDAATTDAPAGRP